MDFFLVGRVQVRYRFEPVAMVDIRYGTEPSQRDVIYLQDADACRRFVAFLHALLIEVSGNID